jgi:hypothetical protein
MTCQNRTVLLWVVYFAAHNNEGLTLKHAPIAPTGKCHQLPATVGPGHHLLCETNILKASIAFLLVKNRLGCSHRRSKKMKHLQWLVRHLHDMEIHDACSNTKLLCKMWLWQCKLSQYWQWWINRWMGGTARPHWLPQYFWKISEWRQICPKTTDQPKSLDSPSPSSEHVLGHKEVKMVETQHVPTVSLLKNALMVLSVLDSVVSASAGDDVLERCGWWTTSFCVKSV